jgi:CMP-N-acetylneuraminic acid synthetase
VSVLCVVPARRGSKGIPQKNLAELAGEPLIVHTLRAALAAATLDRVVVSTDDEEIAAVALSAGAEVVNRPAHLAGDDSPTEDALLHALETLGPPEPEYVVTLEPTSPLRKAQTIDACVRRAFELGANAVIAVAETREVLGRLEDGVFVPLDPNAPRRRQLRAPLYRETGVAYVTRTAHLRATHSVFAGPLYAVVVPEEETLDVNTKLDLLAASAALEEGAR